jgi:hypothetical protein
MTDLNSFLSIIHLQACSQVLQSYPSLFGTSVDIPATVPGEKQPMIPDQRSAFPIEQILYLIESIGSVESGTQPDSVAFPSSSLSPVLE